MTGWEPAEVEGLAMELVGTGLATANPYNHLALNPALCPYLKASLSEEERQGLTKRWQKAMSTYLNFLYQQITQNSKLATTLTLLELPNLFALLESHQAPAEPETTIARANILYTLLRELGKTRLLKRVAWVRDGTATVLPEGWSNTRFEVGRTRIDQQLADGQLEEALTGAEGLLEQAQAAGENAYPGADYDLAMALKVLGQVLGTASSAQQALPLLQEAGRRFDAIAIQRSNTFADVMVSNCLITQGDCLRDLGRYDAAAAAYEESIRRGAQVGALRYVAVGKGQLGTVRLEQQRYSEALEAFQEALDTFSHLNEPASVAIVLFKIGTLFLKAGKPDEAEQAYNQSLQISVRNSNYHMQGKVLNNLGALYERLLNRFEEAVKFYKQSANIYLALGNIGGEAGPLNNLAETLRKLKRLEEARTAVKRSIDCKEAFGHTLQQWTSMAILADIETDAGNTAAAADARHQALGAFLAYRRDGGENQTGSGRLALAIRQALASGDQAEAATLLQQLAADPDFGNQLSFLTALQAVTTGSRDRSLAEDPGLGYEEAAEVLLLIEALEAEAGG
jgi:tetratricopeptide (TPR) repeat protein